MKITLRFLLVAMVFGFTGFVSASCSLSHDSAHVIEAGLFADAPIDADMVQAEGGGDQHNGDDEDEQGGITLINNTGVEFYVYRFDPDDDQTTNLLVGNGASITLMAEETDFYVNTSIPSNGLNLSSFGINDGDLHLNATYAVELYDQMNGHALFDAHHHPVWHMRFTEEVPAGQAPHIFTIVRLK